MPHAGNIAISFVAGATVFCDGTQPGLADSDKSVCYRESIVRFMSANVERIDACVLPLRVLLSEKVNT